VDNYGAMQQDMVHCTMAAVELWYFYNRSAARVDDNHSQLIDLSAMAGIVLENDSHLQ